MTVRTFVATVTEGSDGGLIVWKNNLSLPSSVCCSSATYSEMLQEEEKHPDCKNPNMTVAIRKLQHAACLI